MPTIAQYVKENIVMITSKFIINKTTKYVIFQNIIKYSRLGTQLITSVANSIFNLC